MVRSLRCLLLIILLVSGLTSVVAQVVSKNTAFSVGERFSLDAYFNLGAIWIKLGEAEFRVEEEEDNYKFIVTAHNMPKWDRIYQMNTYHEASCTKNMKPLYMKCKVSENGNYYEDSYIFIEKDDHYEVHRHTKNKQKFPSGEFDTTFTVSLAAHDIINSVYVARNTDLTQNNGKKIPFSPIFGNGIHTIYGDVIGKETIKTRENKIYKCLKGAAYVGDGTIVDGKTPAYVYVTDDEHLIPVLVEAKLSIGSVKVYLRDCQLK